MPRKDNIQIIETAIREANPPGLSEEILDLFIKSISNTPVEEDGLHDNTIEAIARNCTAKIGDKNGQVALTMYNFFGMKIKEGRTPPKPKEIYEETRTEAALKIQAAFRGMIGRRLAKKAKEASKGKKPEPTGSDSETILQQAYNNTHYEGTLKPDEGTMDRVLRDKELRKIGPTQTTKDNRLLRLYGQIGNNGLPNGYPHDNLRMDQHGNIIAEYDLSRAWCEYEYSRSLLDIHRMGSNGQDIGTFQYVEFKGARYIDQSYKIGETDVHPREDKRPSELIYVNKNGDTLRYVGAEMLKQQMDEEVSKYNALSEKEKELFETFTSLETLKQIEENFKGGVQIIIGTILGTEEDPIDLTHENSKKILEIIRRNLKHQDDPDDIELDLTEIKERYESSDQSVKDKILLESQIKLFSLSKKLSTQEESAALQIYSIAQSIDQDKIRQKQLDVLRGEVFEGKHGKIEEKLLPTFRELLGLEESSSIQEVQKAYNGAHPDIKEKINLEIKFRFKILAIDDPVGLPKKGDERYEALKKAPNNPLSSEEIISVLKTDPALKEKVELEVKLSQRAGFQQHAQKLEGQTGEQRYDTLRAINRHENRQYSQEFIQQQFTEQEQSMAGQKEALAQFRKELLRKSSTIFPSSRMADNEVFRDLTGTNPTFPISPHGVARSLKYTGAAAGGSSSRTTKIAKISFNSPEGEDIKEEDNEQFIQIPGTNFYKRVVRIPAGKRPEGSSAFYYKDGVKKEIETSNEERILIDENTAWRMTKVRIPDSNPPKFATKPVPYKMFNSRGHPSSALKRDITHSMLPFITRGYKNLGIESISMENGQVKAMSYQRAGSRNVTTTVTQNDVAKSMLAGEQKIIADLMKKSKSGGGLTEEESATLASTIATHEENLNRLSKRGVATTKYVNALIKAMGGEEKLDRVYEVNDRMGMVAEDEMKRITPILKNPTLRELDGHVTTTNQRPSIQQFRRQLARYAVMTANQMVTKSGRENFLAKIFTLANDALSKNTVELDRDQFNKDLLKEIKDYARASGDKRSKLWITNPGKWLPRGFRKIEKDRVDNALTKVPEEQKTTFRLEQNVINTLRNHNRVNTLESYGEFRNAMTKLENDIQVRFAGSSKYESSIKRMFPSIPYVRDGAEVSRTDAVKHLGKIFDSLFSRDMRTLFQDEEVSNRPDVKEFSRSVARYAVETAQGLLSSSGRKETLEGILKLANDELTKHGIVVDTEQFTDQLTSNISAYAAARSGESYRYSPLGRRTGYNATGGSRLTAAAEGFASEDGGRILSEEENKCLQIILNSSIIAVEPGDLDVIRELPVTSIARVIQGYQAAMDEEVTTIKPPKTIKDTDPPNEPYEILKKQIFEEGRDFGTDPIDLTNPVDLLKTRQYEYEAAKLIAQTAKSRFSREKTEEVKRIGYKMTGGRAGTYEAKGRNPFIDTEIENATEALVGMADDTISTQITELVGQHALDKKEKAGILKPSHPKTRYGNIAAKTGSTETTEKKWTKRIKQRDTGEVGDGGREAG